MVSAWEALKGRFIVARNDCDCIYISFGLPGTSFNAKPVPKLKIKKAAIIYKFPIWSPKLYSVVLPYFYLLRQVLVGMSWGGVGRVE